MNVDLFSVFDMAAARFMDPFCAPTMEFAIRGFKECCETQGHQFQKFPEDYALYMVGSFDAETGVMTPGKSLKISMASSFVVRQNNLDPFPDRPEGWPEMDNQEDT